MLKDPLYMLAKCGRISFVLLLITSNAFGQQDALFSQFMFNQIFYNPAWAGLDGTTYVAAAHRTQWAGYSSSFDGNNGAPSTQLISFVTPLPKGLDGAGITLVRDQLGPITNFEVQLSMAFQKQLSFGTLSFGLRPSLFSHSLDFNKFRPVDPEDPQLRGFGKETQMKPDLSAGVYYSGRKFFGGVGINHILQPGFDFGADDLDNKLEPSINFYGGYNYQFNANILLTPSVFIRSEFNTLSFDLGALATYKEIMWGGLSYRLEEAIVLILGYSFLKDKSLRFAYSFDLVVQSQEAKEPTSHEITLRKTLSFTPPGPRKIVRTPRFRF